MQAPTTSPLLDGRWKLLFTTRPGTASPIQRSFTGVEAFSVFQVLCMPRTSQNHPNYPNRASPVRTADCCDDAATSGL